MGKILAHDWIVGDQRSGARPQARPHFVPTLGAAAQRQRK
jgi:hypothetical protein